MLAAQRLVKVVNTLDLSDTIKSYTDWLWCITILDVITVIVNIRKEEIDRNMDSHNSAADAPLSISRARQALTLTLVVLGLLALICGSSIMAQIALGIGTPNAEAGSYALFVIWPLTMLMVALLGAFALTVARRQRSVAVWLVVCFLACIAFYVLGIGLGVLFPSIAIFQSGLLIIPIFLITDGCVVYAGWRMLFGRKHTTSG